MNKLTRRFKKKRKNKTFKGGSDKEADRPLNVEPLKDGVHAVGNVIESVNDTVGDGVGWIKDTASEAVVGTTNFLSDKTNDVGNSIIGAIANKVQESMPVNISEQGVDIIENKTEKIIEAEAAIAKKALDQTTEIMKEKLPDIANAAGTAAAAAFEAIPGIGSIAAIGTLLNKGTEAAEKSLDMVNKIQDVAAESLDTIDETLKQVKDVPDLPNIPNLPNLPNLPNVPDVPNLPNLPDVPNLPNLPNIPDVGAISPPQAEPPEARGGFKNFTKQKAQIGGRINDSIAAFTDPIGYQLSILKGGNNKTKRLVKRNKKSKSRRVRFSF